MKLHWKCTTYKHTHTRLWLCLETSAYNSILRKAKSEERENQSKFGQYSDANRHAYVQKGRRWRKRGGKENNRQEEMESKKNWLHSIAHMFRVCESSWIHLESVGILTFVLSFTLARTLMHPALAATEVTLLCMCTFIHHPAVSIPRCLALAQWKDVNYGTILQYPNIQTFT